MDQTPLMRAAGLGHEGVVKLILEREVVNPNQANSVYGQAALWLAARNKHEGIVKMLLGPVYL